MALIVETGAIVADANSFNTLVELRAYALARGVTLSATDSEVEADSFKAMDYIAAQEGRMAGDRVSIDQELCYPREGVTINGFCVPSDAIPKTLKSAHAQLVIDAHNGVDLLPTGSGAVVKREKVGPLETEYAVSGSMTGRSPELTAADALLAPLYGSGGFLITERA